MKIIDVAKPERVNRLPDRSVKLFSGNYSEQGFIIKSVELRQYEEKSDQKSDSCSLITSLVETDKGSIEITYYEGEVGKNSLDEARELLVSNLGLSGLILRSIIILKEEIKKHNGHS
jgi:hypothetical protein